jgi:NAD(P)H dehydrogenase (quinone)
MGMTVGLKVTSDIGIWDFVGIEPVDHLLFGSIGYLDEEEYKGMLKQVEDTINSHFS